MMMKKVRVAVLGYGHLGKWHCQKVAAHFDMADFIAIVEKFPSGQEAAKTNHPGVKVVSDVKEIINEIDAAFIVTPTSTHFELVSYLLQNGKHVFCEKPVCSNDLEGKKLAEIAQDKNLILQVGHSERFHEAWDILKEKLKNLPTPFTVRINRVAAFKGRATDVDVVQDLAIHDLDLLMHLFKVKPVSINAHGFKIRTDKWDHASIHVEMEEGCNALITVGRNHVKEMRDVEILSKNGAIYIDLFNNKIMEASSSQYEDNSFVKESSYTKRDHLLLEHGFFYKSVLEGKPAVVTLRDGLNAVHLVDCSLKSMDQNSSVKVSFHG
jgi:predicted dehydrogenase